MLTYLLWGQSLGHTVSLSENMTLMHQIVLEIWQNHWTMEYRSHRPTFILRSNVGSYWPTIPKYDVHTSNSLQDATQNHWTMKYRSQESWNERLPSKVPMVQIRATETLKSKSVHSTDDIIRTCVRQSQIVTKTNDSSFSSKSVSEIVE